MRQNRLFSAMKRPLAALLALMMLLVCLGCTEQDINNALDIADAIVNAPTVTSEPTEESDVPTQEVTAKTDTEVQTDPPPAETEAVKALIDEDGCYYSRDEVALYIHTYGKLPDNFITKDEAEELGWEGGSVERYREGAAIGGDRFGNREGLLPKASGRVYYECDIDTDGSSSRGAKRIVFSNDGLIYYTDDHYESFTLLYGEE